MADLFTRGELASYMQIPDPGVDDATSDLLLALITTEIRLYVGAATYDAMADADQVQFKGIALEAVKRAYLNPAGLRSLARQVDDYVENKTWATETFGGVELVQEEQDRIDRILGRAGGAFTVRPAGTAPFRSYPRVPWGDVIRSASTY